MRRFLTTLAVAMTAMSLSGCLMAAHQAYRMANGGTSQRHHSQRQHRLSEPPILILVSIDGFRYDYLDRGVTPTLRALADEGVRAERMSPSFPSITFPNHYTLVTGLVPDHHGIVANTFEDPAIPPGLFKISDEAVVSDRRWWDEATPIWVSAERQGVRTGTEFWPGSEAAIQGVRPSLSSHFDKTVTSDQRVDKLLSWLDLPEDQRPRFLTLYFDIVDTAGHHDGPDSPEVDKAAAIVDAAIAHLRAGLEQRNLAANLVIVADHGMAPTPPGQLLFVDDWTDAASFRSVSDGPVSAIVPADAAVEARIVGKHGHAECYRKKDIPVRLQYGTNPRIAPVICIAEVGWQVTTHARAAKQKHPDLGEHGYDPAAPQMGALFIASGPSFKSRVVLKQFPNVDVYPMLAKLIGVAPMDNDGSLADVAAALR